MAGLQRRHVRVEEDLGVVLGVPGRGDHGDELAVLAAQDRVVVTAPVHFLVTVAVVLPQAEVHRPLQLSITSLDIYS